MARAAGGCVMSAPVFVAGGALLVSAGGLFCFMPLRGAGAGECARRRSNFLLLRQKKVTKEKATPLSASPALRYGATCGARGQGALRNSLRACGAPLKQPQRVSSRSACVLRHTRHPARCAPRRIQRGVGAQQPLGPLLRSALCCGHKRLAQDAACTGSSAATTRMAVGVFTPCWLRLRRGGCGVAWAPVRPCFVI